MTSDTDFQRWTEGTKRFHADCQAIPLDGERHGRIQTVGPRDDDSLLRSWRLRQLPGQRNGCHKRSLWCKARLPYMYYQADG